MDTLLVQWSSHWAPRCAAMRGALGVPWRTCHTDNTSPCTPRAARRVRAAACRQATTADPDRVYHSRPTQGWRPTLGAHRGGATAPSLPCASCCEAHRAVRFSPPREGLSRRGELCHLLTKNARENFEQQIPEGYPPAPSSTGKVKQKVAPWP